MDAVYLLYQFLLRLTFDDLQSGLQTSKVSRKLLSFSLELGHSIIDCTKAKAHHHELLIGLSS